MALTRMDFATGANLGALVESTETEAQFAARVRALVARSKADPRPSMTSEQARSYLDARLASVLGKKAPQPRF